MDLFAFENPISVLLKGAFFPLAVGLGSSFTHCAGMCGPIHFFLASKKNIGKWIWIYHAGRILGYGFIGLLLGLLGHLFSGLTSPAFRIGMAMGLIILYTFFGLGLLGWIPSKFNFEKMVSGIFPNKIFGKMSAHPAKRLWLFPAGLLASLLPCPSTHAVMLWSLGLDAPWKSAGAMILLGIATLPIFVLLPVQFISRPQWSGRVYQGFIGMVFLGLSIWRIYGLATHGPSACH